MTLLPIPLLLAALLVVPPQDREARSDPVEEDYNRLMRELEPSDASPPPLARQIAAMTTFLEGHGGHHAHKRVLQLRTRLGTALLHACEFASACTQFELVLARTPQTDYGHDLRGRDLRGRALYGQAQALELLDRKADARQVLKDLVAVHAGDIYGRYARAALARLEQGGEAAAGQRAPEFAETLVDRNGRPHQLATHTDRGVVLVFWSPDLPASILRLRTAIDAWQRGGGSKQRVLALALSSSAAQVDAACKAQEIDVPVLLCSDEFVHPLALAYRITKVPTLVVVTAGGTIAGRDFSASELERLAATLH